MVTIAVPMLDERGHIERCVEAFGAQDWPLDRLDVLVIDGGSTDGSREWVELEALARPWLRVVDNPVGSAAAAFNIGMHQARGEVVCLFSSHGVPATDYVRRSVEVLHETGAAGVGGRYRHVGETPRSMAIGLAMVSPFGMASMHRFASRRCEVDTISHPAYWRDAMVAVGDFDEGLARNSDYEFNHRMRVAGHRLVFDPSIDSVYRPRPSLRALGRQFWSYGRWKARVVARHPDSLRPRHLVAPVAVAGGALTPVALVAGGSPRRAALFAWAAYAAAVTVGVALARPRRHGADPRTLAAAFPVMHGAWGAGFLLSTFQRILGRSS